MHRLLFAVPVLAVLTFAPATISDADAQGGTVSRAEIQRLDEDLDVVSSDVDRLRSTDASLARQLEDEIDEVREEVTYLRVKSRKEGVSRDEYDYVRVRIDDLRRRARGTEASGTASPGYSGTETTQADRRSVPGEIPVGQELDVRIQTPLSSATAQIEDRFEATTLIDLYEGERVLVPAGSVMRGVVSGVEKAGRMDRKGSLTLAFDQLTVRGVDHPIRATVTQAIESKGVRGEAGRIGIGAVAGGIIGGILGGAQGALAGILVGGGGVLAAVPGKDVELPAGTVLRVRFDSPAGVGSAH